MRLPWDWYKAGDKYDVTYTGLWGDVLFSGVQFGTPLFAMTGLDLPLPFLSQEDKRTIFEKGLSENREKLIVSCEFYLKAIEINPKHFYANLQLASALTAALQVLPGSLYWGKAILLNQAETLKALNADSMGKFYRIYALELVMLVLEDNQAKIQAAIPKFKSDLDFLKQMKIATDVLKYSPYIKSRINNLGVT